MDRLASTPPRGRRSAARSAAIGVLALLVSAMAPAQSPQADMALRMKACTPCHGPQGRAASTGYQPRIAGKPAGYLFNQLVHFREGRRQNALMGGLVAVLDDAYLREIAAYFASLDLPYPPAQTQQADAARLAAGERLVRRGDAARRLPACTACHGDGMTGVLPVFPGLLGLPRDYLVGQLGAWRTGTRRAIEPDCMAQIARRLEPDDVEAVTLWLSAQAPRADMSPAPAASLARPLPMDCGGVAP